MRNLIAHLGLVLMGVLLTGLGAEVTLRVTDGRARGAAIGDGARRGAIVILRTWPLGLSPHPRAASEITRLERHC